MYYVKTHIEGKTNTKKTPTEYTDRKYAFVYVFNNLHFISR